MALIRKLKRLSKRVLAALDPRVHEITLPPWRSVDDLPHGPGIHLTVAGKEIWFSSPDADLRPTCEAAICLMAPWCAVDGIALRLSDANPSPTFLANVQSATALMGQWWGYRPVVFSTPEAIGLPPAREPVGAPGGVGLFFSGGVDSFYSLVMNPDVRVIVFVVGFDIPLTNRSAWELRIRSYREVADARRVRLITVFTNLREQFMMNMSWSHYHGMALAAVAHSLREKASRWLISASFFPGFVMPWGTHPDLDWRWGCESISFHHFGIDRWRGEKLAAMADLDWVDRNLHVCYKKPTGSGNCGRCEKCVRTRVTYHYEVPGRRCGQMPDIPDLPVAVDGIARLPSHVLILIWQHFIPFMTTGDPLATAIGNLLRRSHAGLEPTRP